MTIDFYYWGAACPLNVEMLALLEEYRGRLEVASHDIGTDFGLAGRLNMFYPTLTVVNDRFRFFSPIGRAFLECLCRGELPVEKPYRPVLGRVPRVGKILPITSESYELASVCVGHAGCSGCPEKVRFLRRMGLELFGFMNVVEGRMVGGAEYVPSICVPYPIPREEGQALITCVYLSDGVYDYKSAPLEALERYLAEQYESALVISDEQGVFPNGDLGFFKRHGYEDLGIVAREEGYCTLHLLKKRLR